MYKNRIDYSTCQYQQPESVELHYSAKYHLENAVKQVTDFRHMSDVIINQAYNISDQHEKAYLSRKQVDATAKKNIYCTIFRNSGFIRPTLQWRITVLPGTEQHINTKKMFKTEAVKDSYIKITCAYDMKKLFALPRI